MYKYLRETKEISNTEIQIMAKLISIGEIFIADHVLLRMCINKVWQFENIMKVMFNHLIHSKKVKKKLLKYFDYPCHSYSSLYILNQLFIVLDATRCYQLMRPICE